MQYTIIATSIPATVNPAMPPSPLTPPTQSPRSLHYDSPFSDYFTDIANSPPPLQTAVRGGINRMDTQILIRREPDTQDREFKPESGESHIRDVEPFGITVGAHEAVIKTPVSSSRIPSDLVDSGLFLEDENDSVIEPPGADIIPGQQESEDIEVSHTLMNHEFETATKDILDKIARAYHQLQKRYEEVKYINDLVLERMEIATNEKLSLRSENDALRLDLHTTITEMLFLKLQLRDIEVKVAPFSDEVTDTDFAQQLDQWTQNWQVTDHRIRGRKATYDERQSCHNTPIRNRYNLGNGHNIGHRGLDSGFQRLRLGERAVSEPILPSDNSSFSSTLSTDVSSMDQGDVEDTVIANGPKSNNMIDCPSGINSLATQSNNTVYSVPLGPDMESVKAENNETNNAGSIPDRSSGSDNPKDRDTTPKDSGYSGDTPTLKDSVEKPQLMKPVQSRWSAIWDALADAAGVLDYEALLRNDRE